MLRGLWVVPQTTLRGTRFSVVKWFWAGRADAGAGFVETFSERNLFQVFKVFEQPFLWGFMGDDFSAGVGDHHEKARVFPPAMELLDLIVDHLNGFSLELGGPVVFLGGHKAMLVAIQQDMVVSIDLGAYGEVLYLQLVIVAPRRGLFHLRAERMVEGCGQGVVEEVGSVPSLFRFLGKGEIEHRRGFELDEFAVLLGKLRQLKLDLLPLFVFQQNFSHGKIHEFRLEGPAIRHRPNPGFGGGKGHRKQQNHTKNKASHN